MLNCLIKHSSKVFSMRNITSFNGIFEIRKQKAKAIINDTILKDCTQKFTYTDFCLALKCPTLIEIIFNSKKRAGTKNNIQEVKTIKIPMMPIVLNLI